MNFNINNIPEVRIALVVFGIDATLKEVQGFISLYASKSGSTVTEEEIDHVRNDLRKSDPGKSFYTKADRMGQYAQLLLLSADGRKALRWAMNRVGHEELLDLLGVRSKQESPSGAVNQA